MTHIYLARQLELVADFSEPEVLEEAAFSSHEQALDFLNQASQGLFEEDDAKICCRNLIVRLTLNEPESWENRHETLYALDGRLLREVDFADDHSEPPGELDDFSVGQVVAIRPNIEIFESPFVFGGVGVVLGTPHDEAEPEAADDDDEAAGYRVGFVSDERLFSEVAVPSRALEVLAPAPKELFVSQVAALLAGTLSKDVAKRVKDAMSGQVIVEAEEPGSKPQFYVVKP